MKNARDEIFEYMDLWEQAQKQFPKEKKKPVLKKKKDSFFGMQYNETNENISEDESEHWREVYYRSLEIDPDDVMGVSNDEDSLNEEEIDQQCLAGMMDIREAKEAKRKAAERKKNPKPKKKGNDPRKPKNGNQTPGYDVKKDGFGKDLAKKLGDVDFFPNPVHFASIGADSDLRVTPNFTDGKELRQLAKLKELLYDLESELLGTDVRGGNAEPIRVKMLAVRRQCESLSQKLIPDPRKDVS
jgi:hypothetical protein